MRCADARSLEELRVAKRRRRRVVDLHAAAKGRGGRGVWEGDRGSAPPLSQHSTLQRVATHHVNARNEEELAALLRTVAAAAEQHQVTWQKTAEWLCERNY